MSWVISQLCNREYPPRYTHLTFQQFASRNGKRGTLLCSCKLQYPRFLQAYKRIWNHYPCRSPRNPSPWHRLDVQKAPLITIADSANRRFQLTGFIQLLITPEYALSPSKCTQKSKKFPSGSLQQGLMEQLKQVTSSLQYLLTRKYLNSGPIDN